MDSSLAQSLAGVILPGELTDFPNPRTNSHIERGRLQGIGHPPDKLPTRTLEIRDSRKAPPEAQNGRTPPNQHIRDKLPHKSGTSPHTIP